MSEWLNLMGRSFLSLAVKALWKLGLAKTELVEGFESHMVYLIVIVATKVLNV